MNHLLVPHIDSLPTSAAQVPSLLDTLGISFHPIASVNWPDDYPYCPEVAFRMAWCPQGLVLHYRVTEQSVLAQYSADDASVWTDSCVECFLRNSDTDSYYNIECNCIGTILVGSGPVGDRHRLPAHRLSLVQRWSSLGHTPFSERLEPTSWEVALVVPSAVFVSQPLRLESGATLRANFYKCGDNLSVPHFVSWSPIALPKPNFHCPDFFGMLELQ